MEGRQYRGYYRGATKQVNQAVEAIHLAAERANATVTELVSTREPTSRRGHSSPTHTKQGHRGFRWPFGVLFTGFSMLPGYAPRSGPCPGSA